MSTTMRAAVCERPGPPEVIAVREIPRPQARPGWTLVQVKAFGLNRSELMTRQGHSPGVAFPRVLGIECVGVVAASHDPGLPPGTTVAAAMGDMGRAYDGGYAEYALLPDALLIPVTSSLGWAELGALPETYLTAHGALDALGAGAGASLLVRGATSSVGMAALALARARGLTTVGTTRNPAKADAVRAAGGEHVIVGDDGFADALRALLPEGPDLVLDLVGGPVTVESLQIVRRGGTVCVTGMLSGQWALDAFEPVAMIPHGTKLTASYSGVLTGRAAVPALQQIIDEVARGAFAPHVDRVFTLDEIVAAHAYMEENRASGKVVVVL